MHDREQYTPGPASGAQIRKSDQPNWELIIVRDLRHSPEKVWKALTDPANLREWAPFDADGNLDNAGATVKLTTVGAPSLNITETKVKRADALRLLEYTWGANDMRWELEPLGGGTRLTLWTSIDRRFISWGAARVAHLFRCDGPSSQRSSYRPDGWCRNHEDQRVAETESRVREAVRY